MKPSNQSIMPPKGLIDLWRWTCSIKVSFGKRRNELEKVSERELRRRNKDAVCRNWFLVTHFFAQLFDTKLGMYYLIGDCTDLPFWWHANKPSFCTSNISAKKVGFPILTSAVPLSRHLVRERFSWCNRSTWTQNIYQLSLLVSTRPTFLKNILRFLLFQ